MSDRAAMPNSASSACGRPAEVLAVDVAVAVLVEGGEPGGDLALVLAADHVSSGRLTSRGCVRRSVRRGARTGAAKAALVPRPGNSGDKGVVTTCGTSDRCVTAAHADSGPPSSPGRRRVRVHLEEPAYAQRGQHPVDVRAVLRALGGQDQAQPALAGAHAAGGWRSARRRRWSRRRTPRRGRAPDRAARRPPRHGHAGAPPGT